MKKILLVLALGFFSVSTFSQDKMNKKAENKTDKMNKKMDNTSDKMSKKMDTTSKKAASKVKKSTP